ncbi:MAG: nucleotide-binding protein [Solirubrobacterales bacterium]|nr:nucleotide-binding protein [Solirubrobacterales bacterium]
MLLPDATARGGAGPRPEGDVSLTLLGLVALEADHELEIFLHTLAYLAERGGKFIPNPGDPDGLSVSSAEIATEIGSDADDPALALAREIISNSVWEIWSGLGASPDGDWHISLIPERARKYQGVTSVQDVLALREPLERQRSSWGSVAPVDITAADPSQLYFPREPAATEASAPSDSPRTVFVVHGRNIAARDAMYEFLRSLGLEPLDWEKLLAATGEAAPYVGEVLAAGIPMAQAVVVLLTPDDEARVRPAFVEPRDPAHERELTHQARPNVLFEAGMSLAIHPKSTILVELGELRPFSDVAGRHLVRMDDGTHARLSLIARLKTAGCPIDMEGPWKDAGDFAAVLHTASEAQPERSGSPSSPPVQFALVEEPPASGSGPVTLRVENDGAQGSFEATVVAVRGSQGARPPWQVRWRNSADQAKEILTGQFWLLDLCEDVQVESTDTVCDWRFFVPDGDILISPDTGDSDTGATAAALRVTVRVTPRDSPRDYLENTVTLAASERGRVAVWDRNRQE